MKNPAIALSILTLVLLGVIFVGTMEMNDINRTQQREIDFLKAKNIQERDLLQKQLELTRDSLNVAYQNIAIAHKESQEARERTQATIRNLNRIIYIKYESDSARTNAIKELYPTFKQ